MSTPTQPIKDVQNQFIDPSDHAEMRDTFRIMEQMRKERLLCDVILSVGNVEVPAHKTVLAASSKYFYADLVLSKENRGDCHITLPSTISPEALQMLVNYMYRVKIQITEENVECLLPAAHTFMLNAVTDNCCKVLLNKLTPKDCLRIKSIAEKYECSELLKKIQHYINDHFSEIVETEQFRTLQFQQLSLLISRDTLTSPAEEKLYEAVMYWLKHDLKARKKYLTGLMQHLRLPLVSVAYIAEHIANEPLLKGDLKSKDFIIEAFQHHFLQKNQIDAGDLKTAHGNDIMCLAVIGGTNSNASRKMEYFDFETGQWSDVTEVPREFFGGAITIDNKIIVFGEDNHNGAIFEYNVNTNQWFTVQHNLIDNPVISGWRSSSIFIANDNIFIAGNTSIAKFNISSKMWSTFDLSSQMRTGYGIAVIGNKIFVIGGSNNNSIQVYNEDFKRWDTLLSPIPIRHNMGIGVIDQTIYIIGGIYNRLSILKSVETFDTTTNSYKQIASLNILRRSPGVVIFNNLLYVIGGHDGRNFLSSIEVYDPKTNTWTLLPASMSIGRENPAVTVVNKTILKDVSYRPGVTNLFAPKSTFWNTGRPPGTIYFS